MTGVMFLSCMDSFYWLKCFPLIHCSQRLKSVDLWNHFVKTKMCASSLMQVRNLIKQVRNIIYELENTLE